MSLQVSMGAGEGITVPYGTIFDDVRKNRGFTDVRGRPDVAAQIAEGGESKALRDLLVGMARNGVYFSLGCDLGCHSESESTRVRRHVAGGYIQFAAIDYGNATTAQYNGLCEAMEPELHKRVGSCRWSVEMLGTWVKFCLPDETVTTSPSMQIWFFATARTKAKALASREELIRSVSEVLHMPEVARLFRSELRRQRLNNSI